MSRIIKVVGREIIDSRGNPTIEAEIHLEGGFIGIASVPSGKSNSLKEAIEIRDNDESRYLGMGVTKSVDIINNLISKEIKGMDAHNQEKIDEIMIELDGTKNKSNLGANTILSVSLANAKAAACSKNQALYEHIAEINGTPGKYSMPVPMINIINGGCHADNNIDIQEFMIQPVGAKTIKESIRMGAEIFSYLAKILKNKNMTINIGDEGGYAPNLKSNTEALDIIVEAIKLSGYKLKEDITIAIDCASSKLYHNGRYILYNDNHKSFSSKEFTHFLEKLTENYPIVSIEDGLDEFDWDGFSYQTKILGDKIQLVGDDLFATNVEVLKKGIKDRIVNSILIKLNQVGSLTETLNVIRTAKKANYATIISHRSGETEDVTIADLAVGTNAGQIKTGSMNRSDRTAKYNQLIRIEEKLHGKVPYNGFMEIKANF